MFEMTIKNYLRLTILLALSAFIAAAVAAQSPNTATIIVAVVDPTGAGRAARGGATEQAQVEHAGGGLCHE